jgi:hypothetical protein
MFCWLALGAWLDANLRVATFCGHPACRAVDVLEGVPAVAVGVGDPLGLNATIRLAMDGRYKPLDGCRLLMVCRCELIAIVLPDLQDGVMHAHLILASLELVSGLMAEQGEPSASTLPTLPRTLHGETPVKHGLLNTQ